MQNRNYSTIIFLSQIKKIIISKKTFNNHLPISVTVISDNLVNEMILLKIFKDKQFNCCKLNQMVKYKLITRPSILSPHIMINLLDLLLLQVNTEQGKVFYSINYFFQIKMDSKSNNIQMHVLREFGCGPILL